MGQERTHRRYSPSQAERFFSCPGSNNLLARVPARPSSIYAIEGTNAHEVVEAALANGVRNAREAHEEWTSLFFEELDDGQNEFYLSVQIALDYVYSLLDENPDAELWLEQFVDPPLPAAPGEAGGYCDIAVFVPSQSELYVMDYKHGAGIAKDVEGNRQAMQYAAGFLYGDAAPVPVSRVHSVTLAILQPRAFHKDGPIRELQVTPDDLSRYLTDLNEAVAECEEPDAPLNAGTWCHETFCDARTVCPARELAALQVANNAFQQITQVKTSELAPPQNLDINRLGLVRFHAATLRKWLDDVDAHCDELARSGYEIPGAKLVETRASRRWYGDEKNVARQLAAMIGDNDANAAMEAYDNVMKSHPVLQRIFAHKMTPITSAEKLVVEAYKRRVGRGRKKKAAEQARQAFAYLTLKQSSGNLTLVNEDDPRPAVNRAQSTFGQIVDALPKPDNG